jgi:hypothetical protein
MAFEDYSPKDRRLSGRVHLASWLILLVLVGILAVALPLATSGTTTVGHLAAAAPDDCPNPGVSRRI